MVTIERYNGDETEWDGFARQQRGYSHFHRLAWRSLITKVFGHECLYLAARDETKTLVGVLPLVRVRSLVFGHYLVSMPFLNYGGPLGGDEAIAALVSEAARIAKAQRVKLLELRSRVPLQVTLDASHRKITVVLDLPSSSEQLFAKFDAKLRSQIRRPQKEGATVQFGADQVIPFYRVFSRHMRDLGTPTQPLRFFQEIAARFPDDSTFACVYIKDQPVAAGCGFRYGDEFEMSWAASLRGYNKEAPNMLVYWACMQKAISEGVTRFNFGRCTPGSGTHRFKMQWGGREEQLWWYGVAASTDVTTPSPHDPAFAWGPRLWRRLPASLATTIGPSIVRYIP